MADVTRTGQCLCGAIRITATFTGGIGACHCGSCRKWGGGPLMTVNAGPKVEIEGEDALRVYDSSGWAERGFCGTCGSNLFYHLKPGDFSADGEYILSAGIFPDLGELKFDHEVFVDGNPGWYSFEGNDSRKRMTEADIMAMVGANQEGSQ